MDYEKEYKEALERAKEINNEHRAQPFDVMTRVFSELRESEDEKIKKEIIYHIQNCDDTIDEVTEKRMVAWLEKQGEQKPINDTDEEIVNAVKNTSILDLVEPKFKNGQWIVWQDKYYKVNYNACGYELVDQNGLSTSLEYGTVEESAHLWTIQDAKDGDVLQLDEITAIFKNYIGNEHCICYCSFCKAGGFEIPIENGDDNVYGCYDDTIPATKEQRELLFQKMNESGYEWDAEKKEPKKIHVIDEGKAEMDYCFTKMMNGEKISPTWSDVDEADLNNIIWLCNNCINGSETTWVPSQATRIKSLIERIKDIVFLHPKQEWSEEDEQMLNHIICDIESIKEEVVYCKTVCNEEIDWLKSLKERIQPKVELTQLDKNILEAAIAFVEQNNHFNCWCGVDKHTVLSALHSLRPKNIWKPSDEQMKALSNINVTGIISYAGQGQKLIDLYNDLRKLEE